MTPRSNIPAKCPHIWVRLKATDKVGKVSHRAEVYDLVVYEVILGDGHCVEVSARNTEPATISEMLYCMAQQHSQRPAEVFPRN